MLVLLPLPIHFPVVPQILPAGESIHPLPVVEVPADGLFKAFFELEGRFPAEFALEFGGVDGVALIVAGTVGDKGDEVQVSALRAAEQTVGGLYQQLYKVYILPLIEAAYIVGLGGSALMENQIDRPGVVLNIKPIPHILSLAIDRQGLTLAYVVDKQRNQLFRELIRPVIVGTVGHYSRHPVSVVIGPDKMV